MRRALQEYEVRGIKTTIPLHLRILAEQEGRAALERDIKVVVAQEGLFVAATGRDDHVGPCQDLGIAL